MTKPNLKVIILIALLSLLSIKIFANNEKMNSRIKPPQAAPLFSIKDVTGKEINLANLKGKKVMLTFYRNAGCPICNLRFHELQQQAEYFKSKGLVLLAVYESTATNMQKYIGNEQFYASMIPNPDQSLYKLYDIERSMGKVMKGMFHGAMGKMNKGKKLFKTKVDSDGNANRISADFLIDENGKVQTAYYGKYVGDQLPVSEIKKFLN